MKKEELSLGGAIGVLIFLIVFLIFFPALLFWVGYFSGWLPMIGGALAWVGSFFKGSSKTVEKASSSFAR